MDDPVSQHMRLAPHEEYKRKRMLRNQRIHFLQSSQYAHESAHGKGSWKKDNPKAAALLDKLLNSDADDDLATQKPTSGPEKGDRGAASRQSYAESKATSSMAGTDKPPRENYTPDVKQIFTQNWGGKRKK